MTPATKAIHQTIFEQENPTTNKLLWMPTQKWSQ